MVFDNLILLTDSYKASAAQRSVLDLAEAWFSIEGGLSAAAERMGDLGKVVPKVMHA